MNPATILIVEDNPITRKIFRITLQTAGYNVQEAPDGKTALSLAREKPPDLIIQDLILPDTNGLDLIGELRALPALIDVPILACSGLLVPEEQARLTTSGFNQCLMKPIEPSRLLESVSAHLPSRSPPEHRIFSGRRILIADDDSIQLKLARVRFEQAGFQVETAANGAEALEIARRNPPDVILSDILMPECDGFGLSLAVRQEPQLAQVPVVLISSYYTGEEDRRLAQKMGANAFVLRSPDLQLAIEAVAASLKEEKPPSPIENAPSLHAEHQHRIIRQLERQVAITSELIQGQALWSVLSSFLGEITEADPHASDIQNLINDLLSRYLDLCGYPIGAAYMTDGGWNLILRAHLGLAELDRVEWAGFFGQKNWFEEALRQGEPISISSPTVPNPMAQTILSRSKSGSMLLCPLSWRKKAIGLLVLASPVKQVRQDWVTLSKTIKGPISQALALAQTLSLLASSEQRFRGISDSMKDGIVTTDPERRITYANPAFLRIFGFNPAQLLGRPLTRFLPIVEKSPGKWSGTAQGPDGRHIPLEATAISTADPKGKAKVIYIVRDLSDRDQLELFARLANQDPLTGLLNRRRFDEIMIDRLNQSRRHKMTGAVLFLDLDHFKWINDSLGHAVGDEVLKRFTRVLNSLLRKTDNVARLGGDEFAYVLSYCHADGAQTLAERILERLSGETIESGGKTVRLSCSIGIALYPAHGQTPRSVLECADQALYEAKAGGRNRFCFFDPTRSTKRPEIATEHGGLGGL